MRIEIVDSGIGIGPVMPERIFLPFDQGNLTGTHRFGGLGLGLAIAPGCGRFAWRQDYGPQPGNFVRCYFCHRIARRFRTPVWRDRGWYGDQPAFTGANPAPVRGATSPVAGGRSSKHVENHLQATARRGAPGHCGGYDLRGTGSSSGQ